MQKEILSEEEIKQLASRAHENSANASFFPTADLENLEDIQTPEEVAQEALEKDKFDIFDNVIKVYLQAGKAVRVLVYRNNEMVDSSLANPQMSWKWIQDEFGAGQYKVQAKNVDNGRFIKQETKWIADIIKKSGDSDNTSQLLSFVNQMRTEDSNKFEKIIEDIKESKSSENSSNTQMMNTLMTGLITAMTANNKPDGNNDMFKFMMEQQSKSEQRMLELMKDMRTETEKTRERSERNLEKMLDSMKGNNDSISLKDYFDAKEQAKKEGREEAEVMQGLIEAKALEKAEILSDKEPESYIDKGLKALMPMLTALSNKGQPLPTNTVQPPLNERRSLSRPENRTAPVKTKTATTTANETSRRNVTSNRQDNRKGTVISQNSLISNKGTKVSGLPSVKSISKVDVISKPVKMVNEIDLARKAQILEMVLPTILESLMTRGGSEDCAILCLGNLQNANIPTNDLELLFTLNEVYALSDEHGITAEAEKEGIKDSLAQWLKEFHESLVQKTKS